jgi:dihydrofolate reductase
MTELVLIAAVARNGAIGRDNDLVFGDPADQKHFRQATMGCPVIMGRKTWDSLPERFRPLPGRRNVVVTRQDGWRAPGAECAGGLEEDLALTATEAKVFVMGGGELYALALPQADTLLLTEVDADLEGDTFFPDWDRSDFNHEDLATHHTASGLRFDMRRYRRKSTAAP